MPNVLINLPEEIISKIDDEVARLAIESFDARQQWQVPPPLSEDEKRRMLAAVDKVHRDKGLAAAQAFVAEQNEKRKRERLAAGQRTKAVRWTRTNFVLKMVIEGFEEYKKGKLAKAPAQEAKE